MLLTSKEELQVRPKKKESKRDARKRRKEEANQSKTLSNPNGTTKPNVMPYTTFIRTESQPSILGECAGTGLCTTFDIPAFTWIGFYPGDITVRRNRKKDSHTMASLNPGVFIVADPAIKTGVHMINEASPDCPANTYYVKLPGGNNVLYFTATELAAGTELLTCYSRNYGKRGYPISRKCTDPRCNAKHRTSSECLEEWKDQLRATRPDGVDVEIPENSFSWDLAQQKKSAAEGE